MSDLQCFKDMAAEFVNSEFAEFTQAFTIEQQTKVSDGQGGFTKTWAEFASITGFVKIITGKEIINNDRIKSKYATKFSFEHVAGIENDMRIIYNGFEYNIDSIMPVMESTVWTDIVAYKAVAV